MGRVEEQLRARRAEGRKSLVVYLTAGDPDVGTSVEAAIAAFDAGADVLEIGVPFSDPTADGPVIQAAMQRALASGGGLTQALEVARKIRAARTDAPIVLFGYANPLHFRGYEQAARDCAAAGIDAWLVVDTPMEEAEAPRSAAAAAGIDWVGLVAPTSGESRAGQIATGATAFVYVISMTGVTGSDFAGTGRVAPLLESLRGPERVPVCVGFGVSDRSSAASVAKVADGVVVGSAIVKALENGGVDAVRALVRELREGVDA